MKSGEIPFDRELKEKLTKVDQTKLKMKGQQSDKEQGEIIKLCKQYGKDFEAISKKFKKRSKDACRGFVRKIVMRMQDGQIPKDQDFLDKLEIEIVPTETCDA